MSGSELKDFLTPSNFSYPVNQRIETDIIYPVSKSQSQVKFIFDKKGILDNNSKVRLKVTCAQVGGNEPNCFLPIHTGISSVISRAWLEIGGRRVSMSESCGSFNTLLNLSYTQEFKQGILKTQEGIFPKTKGASSNGLATTGLLGVFNGGQNSSIDPQIKLKSTEALSPEFAIPLSRLIPMLKGFQLPLFAIDQEVSLTIEFQKDLLNTRYCQRQGEAGTTSKIAVDDCILMADLLYYPDDMDDIAMKIGSSQGYAHLFDEIIVVEATENALKKAGDPPIGAGLHQTTQYEQQIALAGKTLKGIAVQSFKIANGLEGVYTSSDDNIEDSYNFVINSVPFYAQDIKNSALKYTEVGKIFGRNLSVNSNEYCFLNQVTDVAGNAGGQFVAAASAFTDLELEGHSQQVRTATQRWLGLQLSKESMGVGGKVLSNLPILFRRKREIMADNVYPGAVADSLTPVKLTFFCVTGNVLLLKSGQATIIQ
tara:strand:+ start:15543 stop:16991 length:1449 start_codon:yes stop_codon:yes gene_type:complete